MQTNANPHPYALAFMWGYMCAIAATAVAHRGYQPSERSASKTRQSLGALGLRRRKRPDRWARLAVESAKWGLS